MFDPMTFPIARSGAPFVAAIMLTRSSGAEVPNAIIVSPITSVEILRRFAIEAAPSTRRSAPFKRITKPTMNNIYTSADSSMG